MTMLDKMISLIRKSAISVLTKAYLAVNELLCWRASKSLRLVRAAETPDGLTVFTVIRNEAHQLAQFFEHYRSLGFSHFCVVDNGSTDGSSEFLKAQKDVSLYQTGSSFRNSGGGTRWRHSLIKRHGLNRWICRVDADEYLVFSKELGHSIQEVIVQLEQAGLKRLFAPMVDLYKIDDSALEYFDAFPEVKRTRPRGCELWGGVRRRLARKDNPEECGPMLSKYPLSYYDRHTAYTEPHFPHPHERNSGEIYGRLLHRKMTTWSLSRIETAIEEGQHWNHGVEYKRYKRWVGLPLLFENSRIYSSPEDLIVAGLLQTCPLSCAPTKTP
jgi:glycosyltransferase involved in cell wall biosynthesis